MTNPYGGPPPGPQPQQPYGPPSGPLPQQPYPGIQPQQPYGPMGAAPVGMPADWGTRAVGYLIDAGIPFACVSVLYMINMVILFGVFGASGGSDRGMQAGMIIVMVIAVLAYLAIMAFSLWNVAYRRGKTGQTLGQQYMKIKTVSERTGQPIGFGKAFLRQVAHIVDSIICGLPIGWLAPLWDDKKQTWADKIMSTVVVHVDARGAMPHGQLPGHPQAGYPYPQPPYPQPYGQQPPQ